MRYVIGLMAALWCALAAPGQAQAEKRVSLAVGIDVYPRGCYAITHSGGGGKGGRIVCP